MTAKQIAIKDVGIHRNRREPRNIEPLAESIKEIGLLNPITVTDELWLVAGRRRLAACKSLGWEKVHANVLSLDKLTAELAEIDENLQRDELTVLERSEGLKRRKEIYEAKYPSVKHGAAPGKAGGGKQTKDASVASFAADTAAKTGTSKSTIQHAVQIAESITEEAKDAIRDLPIADRKQDLLKLARVAPEKQQAVVAKLTGEDSVRTIDQAIRAVDRHEKLVEAAKVTPSPQERLWEIRNDDCVSALSYMANGSARLIFADPPYNIGIDYGNGSKADDMPHDEYVDWCESWLTKCRDLLTDDGSLWVMIGDEFAAEYACILKHDLGLTIRSWIKWYETFGVNCSNNFNRTSRHIFYCVKDPKKFVFHPEAVNRPSDRQTKYGDSRADPAGKIWDDVWNIPRLVGTAKERIPDFPTQLPLELTRAIVGCASDPGDLVVDPFCGSASTGAACCELGRRFVGIEKQEQFVALASLRLKAYG